MFVSVNPDLLSNLVESTESSMMKYCCVQVWCGDVFLVALSGASLYLYSVSHMVPCVLWQGQVKTKYMNDYVIQLLLVGESLCFEIARSLTGRQGIIGRVFVGGGDIGNHRWCMFH